MGKIFSVYDDILSLGEKFAIESKQDTMISSLASIVSGLAASAVVGGGTEATAQRVTIANDSTGVISVDDNGGSVTVDGTVSLDQSSPGSTNGVYVTNYLSVSSAPLAVRYDDVGSGISYVGRAPAGTANATAGWQIMKFDEGGSPDFSITYADGDEFYDNVWDDRLTTTYS